MPNKTNGVYLLVEDILRTISEPYGEDVIEDVCFKIEKDPNWKNRYDELSQELNDWVVNNWIGKYTKELTRMKSVREVNATRCKIITSYTKLRS